MKRNVVIGTLGAAAIAAAMAFQPVAAGAQAAGQVQSNQSVGQMAARINQDISALNGDDTDYGGHRLKAIAQMQKAHNALAAAEQYAASHGMGAGASNVGAAVGTAGGGVRRQQGQSDANMQAVSSDLQTVINQLNADSADYGGDKTTAIKALQTAVTEIGLGLQYRQQHPAKN
jgi:hypothetical protein